MADAPPFISAPLSAAKVALRREVLRRRDALIADARATASQQITERVLALPAFRNARCILAYASMGSEFDTNALLVEVLRQKKLVLPRVERSSRTLQLFRVNNLAADLQPGVWDIREPHPDRCSLAPLEDIDWILAPGVAFTRKGARLGYGGGYYDKLLARFTVRPAVIAAAFEVQIVDDLPLETSDLPVDMVVTENANYGR